MTNSPMQTNFPRIWSPDLRSNYDVRWERSVIYCTCDSQLFVALTTCQTQEHPATTIDTFIALERANEKKESTRFLLSGHFKYLCCTREINNSFWFPWKRLDTIPRRTDLLPRFYLSVITYVSCSILRNVIITSSSWRTDSSVELSLSSLLMSARTLKLMKMKRKNHRRDLTWLLETSGPSTHPSFINK